MCNEDHPVGRVLTRREVLALFGAAGATVLVGCSIGDSDSSSTPTATTPSGASDPTATETASDMAANTQTETAASTATEPSSVDSTTTTPAESTGEPTSDSAESAASTLPIPTCVVSPELTEGPYFVDEEINRSDIRSDPSTGEVVEGVPLELALRVSRINGDGCTALEGAVVDVWQCNAYGVYSDVSDPGFSTLGQQFLRGYQVTDADGIVRFQTIYPGWYQGRAVHIHFKVRGDAGSGQSYEFTSQFFFDDALTDSVYLQEPYAGTGERSTRNDDDMIYAEAGEQLILSLTEADAGFATLFDIGIQTA